MLVRRKKKLAYMDSLDFNKKTVLLDFLNRMEAKRKQFGVSYMYE